MDMLAIEDDWMDGCTVALSGQRCATKQSASIRITISCDFYQLVMPYLPTQIVGYLVGNTVFLFTTAMKNSPIILQISVTVR